jgi:regulatory protein
LNHEANTSGKGGASVNCHGIMTPSESTAYLAALKLLARRDLSEAQVRLRLSRKGHDRADVDAAVARLRETGAIDDVRVAEAIAHAETGRRHGKIRTRRSIEQAGIAPEIARRAAERAFEEIDESDQLDAALARRLRGRGALRGEAEFARLFRYLVAQGFEPDRVMAALRKRKAVEEAD